ARDDTLRADRRARIDSLRRKRTPEDSIRAARMVWQDSLGAAREARDDSLQAVRNLLESLLDSRADSSQPEMWRALQNRLVPREMASLRISRATLDYQTDPFLVRLVTG